MGLIYTAGGLILLEQSANSELFNQKIGNLILGIGLTLRASSHFVMRADNLPPRKSVFKRTVEWMKEKYSNLKEDYSNPIHSPLPGLIPISVRSENSRIGLENYFSTKI